MQSARAEQVAKGSQNRWAAEFGLTPDEVSRARELSKKTKCLMREACEMVFRDASNAARRLPSPNTR